MDTLWSEFRLRAFLLFSLDGCFLIPRPLSHTINGVCVLGNFSRYPLLPSMNEILYYVHKITWTECYG